MNIACVQIAIKIAYFAGHQSMNAEITRNKATKSFVATALFCDYDARHNTCAKDVVNTWCALKRKERAIVRMCDWDYQGDKRVLNASDTCACTYIGICTNHMHMPYACSVLPAAVALEIAVSD